VSDSLGNYKITKAIITVMSVCSVKFFVTIKTLLRHDIILYFVWYYYRLS